MTARKTVLALATAALASATAWALPVQAVSQPFGPTSSTPNNTTNPGSKDRSAAANDAIENAAGKHTSSGQSNSHTGHSHKCKPHKVAYVASGTLESWSPTVPTKNADGTYNVTLTVLVTHTNHHAAGDKSSTPKEYILESVRVTFGLADTNNDGGVGFDDLAKGDSVKLIGKISAVAKKCSHTDFTPTTTIRHIVFHAPKKAG